MTMHVDNWDPDTYLWILQEIDVPYIPNQWNQLLAKYSQDKSKITIGNNSLKNTFSTNWLTFKFAVFFKNGKRHIEPINSIKT